MADRIAEPGETRTSWLLLLRWQMPGLARCVPQIGTVIANSCVLTARQWSNAEGSLENVWRKNLRERIVQHFQGAAQAKQRAVTAGPVPTGRNDY